MLRGEMLTTAHRTKKRERKTTRQKRRTKRTRAGDRLEPMRGKSPLAISRMRSAEEELLSGKEIDRETTPSPVSQPQTEEEGEVVASCAFAVPSSGQ
jgi:hypothetical protein